MEIYENILETLGNTPLIKLGRFHSGPATLAAKVESFNPGGSVKDRIGIAMIEAAEKAGLLKPGGTIVEPTSGNTGVGLALVANLRGYRLICTCAEKIPKEKIALLEAMGATVLPCPTDVEADDPRSYYKVAERIRDEEGAFLPYQYYNQANPEAHYRSTGPEIWRQTDGKVTHWVVGVGTGGTISGVARYLKERKPDVKIIGADPEGSVLSGGTGKPWKVEGIGEDFVPKTFNGQFVDEWIRIGDAESFHVARQLARREGILAGGSSGTNLAAALKYAQRCTRDDLIVTLICDTGRNYLSKFFDDGWLAANNLLDVEQEAGVIADLLQQRGPRQLVTISPEATVADAIDRMQATGISQLPVLDDWKPVGSVQEVTLARVLHDNADPGKVKIGEVMAKALPTLDVGVKVDEAYRMLLAGHTGVLALSDGKVVDIVTRIDLVQWYQQRRKKG